MIYRKTAYVKANIALAALKLHLSMTLTTSHLSAARSRVMLLAIEAYVMEDASVQADAVH